MGGYCTGGKIKLFVGNTSMSIGASPAYATHLTTCEGMFETLSYSNRWINRDVYRRTTAGPVACACLARCNRYVYDCNHSYTFLSGWALMLPQGIPSESCSCQNAIMPVETLQTCSPTNPAQSLILGYLSDSHASTCFPRYSPLQEWKVWSTASLSFQDAPILLRCDASATETCIDCAQTCMENQPIDCDFQWPPRCLPDNRVECSYVCPLNASAVVTLQAC